MHRSLRAFGTVGLSLGLVSACAGRTAAWEEGAPKAQEQADTTPPQGEVDGPRPGDTGVAEADQHWATRTAAKPIRQAIAGWERALGCEAGDAEPGLRCAQLDTARPGAVTILTKLTRAHYFLADGYLRKDEGAYLATMNRGVWWGERALVAASPEFETHMRDKGKFEEAIALVGSDGVGAMYWYAASLGKWAKRKSFAVLIGQKDNIRATMTHVLELRPDFFHGAPDRYFGAFYAIAPKFAGGDVDKSKEHYAKSLERAPYYLGTKVLMAENLATKLDDKAMFERLLQEVLAFPDEQIPQELRPEAAVERQKAKELLAQKDDLF